MTDKTRILERLRQTVPRLAKNSDPQQRLDALGADSIDMVELLVVLDSDFGVRLKEDEFSRLATVDDLLDLVVEKSREPPEEKMPS